MVSLPKLRAPKTLVPMALKVASGIVALAVSFAISLWTMDYLWPREAREPDRPPSLAAVPPLPQMTRTSVIVAPVAIALPRCDGARRTARSHRQAG